MDLSSRFKNYLLSQSTPASKATVKNYLSDINRFTAWYEAKFSKEFTGTDINFSLVELFKNESLSFRSASSVERNISSLRKFFTFLKLDGTITVNPFETEKEVNRENLSDPWRIRDFKNYLYSLSASSLTIKNYIIDINQFKDWLEATIPTENRDFNEIEAVIRSIDSRLISDYKYRLLESLRLNPTSVNRKLSSLRKYTSWAQKQGIIDPDTKNVYNTQITAIPLFIPESDSFENQKQTVKSARTYSKFPPLRLLQKSIKGMGLMLSSLFIAPIAYFISQGDKAIWILKGKPVLEEQIKNSPPPSILQPLEPPVGPVRNIPKSFYAPTHISIASLPMHKQIWHHMRYTRPEWYIKYHSYTFTSYLHFAILILFIIFAGYSISTNYKGQDKYSAVLASQSIAPDRILSFRGRITNENGAPIKSGTNLRMSIYRSEEASGSALLWEEVDFATPDEDGIFNVLLGQNSPIPQTLFTNNPELWLGVTVENTKELIPRQEIATVAYAANSETLQNLKPITNSTDTANVILALNSSGNLTIGGSASPTFQATGGNFTISGQTVLLTSQESSNGNIQISPDGTGIVDIQSVIANTSEGNTIVPGSVQIDDVLITNVSSPTTAAFGISQGSTGDLIIASVSGDTRFLVDNGGNVTADGTLNGLSVTSGTITSGTWEAAVIDEEYGGTGINTSASTGVPFISSGTWSVDSNYLRPNHGGTGIDTSSLTGIPTITDGAWSVDEDGLNASQGGTGITSYTTGDILYADSTTSLATLGVGGIGTCLTSNGSTPSWATCGNFVNGTIWREALGTTFLNNSTLDFLVGGQSTTSAKFSVLNVNETRGNQVASLSGDFVFDKNASIQTTNNQTLTVGGSTTGGITIEGNSTINIGTDESNPDTIILGNKNALTKVEILSGNYNNWYIESTGAAKFNTFAGAGLYTDCDDTNEKVVWNATTKEFSCGTDVSGGGVQDVVHITDATNTIWADNDSTELWDGVTKPNITPTDANSELLIMVTIVLDLDITTSGAYSNPVARIDREIGTTADCADTDTIGSTFGVNAFDNQTYNQQVMTYTIIDAPSTTNNVSYTVCTSSDSVLDGSATENRIEFTIIEVNDTEAADFAEIYPTNDKTLTAGEIAILNPEMNTGVMRSQKAYESNIIGVISTEPALTIGGTNGESEHAVPVALAGRVPVRVSTEGGNIKKGDYLTSSSIPGVAMKAIKSGATIGIAMDDYSSDENGSILVFVQNGNTNGSILSLLDTNSKISNEEFGNHILNALLAQNPTTTSSAQSNILTDSLVSTIEIITPKITVGDLNANKIKALYYELGRLVTETAIIASAQITDLSVDSLSLATENITIAGENIRDFITIIVDERIAAREIAISSPILEIDQVKPENKTLSVVLPTNDSESSFEVKNSSESAVFSVDASGNASLSGTLNSAGIDTDEASVSGTLRAGRIDADELNLSDEALKNLQNSINATSSPTINNYYYNEPQTDEKKGSDATGSATLKEITADYGTFNNGLISYGTTSFYDATIANNLYIGAQLSISDRSINVLGANLQIQPLSQGGVEFVGGKISIDVEGNLEVNGNTYFAKDVDIAGKLAANIIKVDPIKGLVFQFEDLGNETPNIEFRTGTGSAVLSFNNQGDINSSGSGTFSKLNLNIISEAIAVSDTEIIATGSAGTAEIKPYQNELTINNPLVTKDSLIYVSPKTSLPNQGVYLLRQIAGESFTVGLSRVVEKSVPFNWILIN